MSFLKRLFGRQRRMQASSLMNEDAREAAYLTAPDNPLFEAVLADLDELTVNVSDRALETAEQPGDHLMRKHLGGQDALLEFKEKLFLRRANARLTEEQNARRKEERNAT